MRGVVGKFATGHLDAHGTEIRQLANRLAKQAGHDGSCELGPDLAQAHEQAAARVTELTQAQRDLNHAADVLGDLAPNGNMMNDQFVKALDSVQQTPEGKFRFKE